MPKNTIIKLYTILLKIRLAEEMIADEYQYQQMRCPVHLCIGEEAVATGICANLRKEDTVFSGHRSHGHFLAKGGNLKKMIAEIYGKATGCSIGRGGSQHLSDLQVNFMGATPIVGGTIPLAVGSAFASDYLKDNGVTVVFFGDAATEEGVFHESLNFAILRKLPVLFVCENNLYSVQTRIEERRRSEDIYRVIKGYGMPTLVGNGNDVLEVYNTASKIIAGIRQGNGPAFLEFKTYRLREHCGPNPEAPGVRPEKEVAKWGKKCPVKKLERYLLKNNLLNRKQMDTLRNKLRREIKEAFDFAKESRFPNENFSQKLTYV